MHLERNNKKTGHNETESKMVLLIQTPADSGFEEWVNWHGFDCPLGEGKHSSFDFAAFKNKDGTLELGIPEWIVVAIMRGKISNIYSGEDGRYRRYYGFVRLDHLNGMVSCYDHIVPEKGLKRGQWVEQGNEIGKVFHGEDDVLPHLDFGIRYQNDYRKYLDPIEIFESEDLRKLTANPQGALIFSIDQLPGATIRYNFPGWSKSWE